MQSTCLDKIHAAKLGGRGNASMQQEDRVR